MSETLSKEFWPLDQKIRYKKDKLTRLEQLAKNLNPVKFAEGSKDTNDLKKSLQELIFEE